MQKKGLKCSVADFEEIKEKQEIKKKFAIGITAVFRHGLIYTAKLIFIAEFTEKTLIDLALKFPVNSVLLHQIQTLQ